MVHFFHEGGGPYLKGEKPPTPSSISNTGLIDGVPPLSANGPLKFIRIIYMGQAHKSNNRYFRLSGRVVPNFMISSDRLVTMILLPLGTCSTEPE